MLPLVLAHLVLFSEMSEVGFSLILNTSMIQKQVEAIDLSDIQNLISNAVAEGRTLEYKEVLQIVSESERKEFLYDVASFANSGGGDIVYGVVQDKETGYPISLNGIQDNPDQLQLKLDSMIRDGLSPRLIGTTYKFVALDDKRNVLILRINKSWNGPHQVTYKGVDRFYSRGSNGKYILDVFELKRAFLASDTLKERISKFIDSRLININANEGPVKLLQNGRIVLHIIPMFSFEHEKVIDIKSINTTNDFFRPFGDQGFVARYNFDGMLGQTSPGKSENHAYLQLFRNGTIESVDSWVVQAFNGEQRLYVNTIEEMLINFVSRTKRFYSTLQIDPPLLLFLTITGANNFTLGLSRQYFSFDHKIDRDWLRFSELLVENWNSEIDVLLKPWFDALWNSVGYKEAQSFQDGKWRKL